MLNHFAFNCNFNRSQYPVKILFLCQSNDESAGFLSLVISESILS